MLPRRVLAPDSAHHGALPYGCYASVEGGQEGECWRGTTVLGPSLHQIVVIVSDGVDERVEW